MLAGVFPPMRHVRVVHTLCWCVGASESGSGPFWLLNRKEVREGRRSETTAESASIPLRPGVGSTHADSFWKAFAWPRSPFLRAPSRRSFQASQHRSPQSLIAPPFVGGLLRVNTAAVRASLRKGTRNKIAFVNSGEANACSAFPQYLLRLYPDQEAFR